MTDPLDDTQPHATGTEMSGAPVDPAAAVPTAPSVAPAAPTTAVPAPTKAVPADAPSNPPAGSPTLRVDPERKSDSGWREPAWFPPRERPRDRRSSPFAIVVGLGLIAIGLWYFLDRTLGIAMPRLSWSAIWPLILIALGGLILIRSFSRRA